MIRLVTVLLFGLCLEAVGVVFLSRGLKEVGEMDRVSVSEVLRLLRAGITNGCCWPESPSRPPSSGACST